MQRIVISQFGPIEHFEADIQDVMLFIGPQASGKSTISKAIFFFKSLKNELMNFIYEANQDQLNHPIKTFSKLLQKRFIEYFGMTKRMRPFALEYSYSSNKKLIAQLQSNGFVFIKFNDVILNDLHSVFQRVRDYGMKTISSLTATVPLDVKLQMEAEKRSSLKIIEQHLQKLFENDNTPVFIPAGRSLLSTLTDQSQIVNNLNLDFFTKAFLERINHLRLCGILRPTHPDCGARQA